MKQSPYCEADSQLADQEIAHLLWNPEVCYYVYKSPLLDPLLGCDIVRRY
jgi:hypothetical protein